MKVNIRLENSSDYRKVEEVAREAFWNLYIPGCVEHCAIHKLRKSKEFIPELTFVIEADGEIIGSIFYSHSKVVDDKGVEHKTITFGPVSILPRYHRQGFGKLLIEHSIQAAKNMGHKAIITLGYPYHYEPYGFRSGKKYGICMPDRKFYKGLLVLPLYEGALEDVSGRAYFSEALNTTEEECLEYDKSFSFKEKKVEESQKEYEIACSLLD